MSTQLVQHLKDVCKDNDAVKILLSQWEFDCLLVGKALENISSYYPHFSNHNSSHSKQILINIERILGKDIDKLSATDTWLILEAAYWHDIGMLVDSKSAKDLQDNEDFNFMVKDIAKRKNHDLYEFAKIFDEQGWSAAICSMSHPFDGVEKYRQLIAEWFRTQHANRVGGIIQDPFDILGINSPRTELLPKRIYRYLGQICMAHGTSFEKVMGDLPYRQTGLGTENCHPRFVACLLRLGDLFDLDDNRFCPVMMKQVGQMPAMSHTHLEKHLSIREFQLDRDTVKVVAECPNEMAYVETQNWFGWIRQEFHNQMANWKFIAPNRHFGLLPTLEQLDVRMTESKVLLDNKPMQFSLDQENVIEILEGSNLYTNSTGIYRELIQNAIDSTLMRVWLQHGLDSQNSKKWPKTANPFDQETRNIISEYPITIDFIKIRDIEGSNDSVWEFILRDKGMGISLNDLRYMQKIAGTSRNIEKQKILQTMPKWMQPSGEFGIGLHSAFLLMKELPDEEQKITFSTKSLLTNESHEIEMYSPLCKKQGYCFISKLSNNKIDNFGTELRVRLRLASDLDISAYIFLPKWLNKYKYGFDIWDNNARQLTGIANTIDSIINNVGMGSIIPIQLTGKWLNICQKSDGNLDNDLILSNERKFLQDKKIYWDRDLEFGFYLHVNHTNTHIDFYSTACFKGQEAYWNDHRHNPFSILMHGTSTLYFDLYGKRAKDVLSISRDTWHYSFENNFEKLITDSIKKAIKFDSDNFVKYFESNAHYSLLKKIIDPNNDLNKNDDHWKDLKLILNQNIIVSINEIMSLEDFIFDNEYIDHINNPEYKDKYDGYFYKETKNFISKFNQHLENIIESEWLLSGGRVYTFQINEYVSYNFYSKNEPKSESNWTLKNLDFDDKPFNEDAVALWLHEFVFHFHPETQTNAKQLLSIPVPLENKAFESLVFETNDEFSFDNNCIIFPYQPTETGFKILDLEKLTLYGWKKRKPLFENLTYDEYLATYKKFVTYIDEKLNKNPHWETLLQEGRKIDLLNIEDFIV